MKYIAFEGTYNEQVYDSETHIITLRNLSTGAIVFDVTILVGNGTWKKYNENLKNEK